MKRTILFFLGSATLALSLVACGGGSDQSSASPSPSPTATPAPDPNAALSVKLLSAVIVGTPTSQNMVPVRVAYTITANGHRGISVAYGSAALPAGTGCDSNNTIGIQVAQLPPGATVQQTALFYCPVNTEQYLNNDTSIGLSFTASSVQYQ